MTVRWHVLGVGAIGGLFAQRLHACGQRVQLLQRQYPPAFRTLTFIEDGSEHTLELPCDDPRHGEPIEHLLVCTKSYAVLDAIKQTSSRITSSTEIVLLTNGMGIGEALRDRYPRNPIMVGTTTAGCYRDKPGHWHPVAAGSTMAGWLDDTQSTMPDSMLAWQQCVPNFQWRRDMREAQLAKLAINAVINPPTALHDVINGDLLSPELLPQFEQACAEVSAVLKCAGAVGLAAQVHTQASAVAHATAGNTSSMRADIKGGKPTEVEAILGYLLEQLPATLDGEAAGA
ncbi:MAG: 2-dehydropantoate 2-reductase, partial [Halieaceae bacterium]|nr:2-dehydropantoate 2-reductase [Halieaceae bacterium]